MDFDTNRPDVANTERPDAILTITYAGARHL